MAGMDSNLHAKLMHWYETNGRHELPWRKTRDPYRIWISEIMLQQTQVKTVLERFYSPFLARFPTLGSLAEAPTEAVLQQWEGLGYYRRAKHLHAAARQCAPNFPRSVEGLLALPGVGKSTAHAIAAFAYRQPLPILDANVKRILYRFFARTEASEKTLWQLAEALFDAGRPFEYNQAMMDLGSLVCTPKAPHCEACPLQAGCKADDPLRYPAPKRKKRLPVRHRHIVAVLDGGRVGVSRREGAFLHGLWGFVERETRPDAACKRLGRITQTYSHFRLEAQVWLQTEPLDGLEYVDAAALERLPMSGADRKVCALIAHMLI